MHRTPQDAPSRCWACGQAYASVSAHSDGLMVNLLENDRYQRVCVEPTAAEGEPCVYFYHHTHEQTTTDGSDDPATA